MIKKITAFFAAAAIAAAAFSVPAGALKIKQYAMNLKLGEERREYLCEDGVRVRHAYKITLPKAGTLRFDFNFEFSGCKFWLLEQKSQTYYKPARAEMKYGTIKRYKEESFENGEDGKGICTVLGYDKGHCCSTGTVYWDGLEAGTYYMRFLSNDIVYGGTGKLQFTLSLEEEAESSISDIAVALGKGDKIKLSPIVEPSGARVEWSSSKESVAYVSSGGKVTAKKKGTAVITAKCGKTKKTIKIIVE